MASETIFFLILAFSIVVSSLLVVTLRNPIHSALSLVSTMLMMAGVYALLNAPFLAVIQVMVYAGAIMVLFLFVIMLLNLGDDELGERRFTLSKFITAGGAIFLFGAVAFGITTLGSGEPGSPQTAYPGLSRLVAVPGADEVACSEARAGVEGDHCEEVWVGGQEGRAAGTYDAASKTWRPAPELARSVALWERFGTVEWVGRSIFGKWVFLFEVTGVLLLAAVIGAVVIAKRRL